MSPGFGFDAAVEREHGEVELQSVPLPDGLA
jgi:hypothetical protein